jgi:hypothetical protein
MNTARSQDDEARTKQIEQARDALLNAIGDRSPNALIACHAITVAAQLATGQRQAPPNQFKDLMRFYAVKSMPALVDMQAYHIERLQEKLRKFEPLQRYTSKVRCA